MATSGSRLLARPQGHDAVLRGSDPGVEGLLQVIAADLHEVLPLLLALAATLRLVGALEEVGGGRRRLRRPGSPARSGCAGRSSKVSAGTTENRSLGRVRQFFADRDQLAVKRLLFALGVLAPDGHLEEVQSVGNLAVGVDDRRQRPP